MVQNTKVGFIGLGIMGEPMCLNIMKAGYSVVVNDIDKQKTAWFADAGAEVADSPSEVAEKSGVIITMLPNNSNVEQAVLGEKGILEGLKAGGIIVDMSTISPKVSRLIAAKVKDKGGFMLDAPVVKSQPAAVTGDLGILAGGPLEVYERVLPILKCMGKNVIHMGENGSGLVMKLCHNMLVGEISVAVSEMLTMAQKEGLEFDDIVTAVSYGGGQNFFLDSKRESLKNRDFTTKFPLQYMKKDMGLAIELGEDTNLKLEGARTAETFYQKAVDGGLGREDFSAVIKIVENP